MLLRKVDGFFGPFSIWTVQNSLDNLDVHLSPMQGCLQPLIASTTGHYNSTGMHSTNLWSAFLTSVQQERALDCTFIVLDSMGTDCHTYQKNILEASEIRTPL